MLFVLKPTEERLINFAFEKSKFNYSRLVLNPSSPVLVHQIKGIFLSVSAVVIINVS